MIRKYFFKTYDLHIQIRCGYLQHTLKFRAFGDLTANLRFFELCVLTINHKKLWEHKTSKNRNIQKSNQIYGENPQKFRKVQKIRNFKIHDTVHNTKEFESIYTISECGESICIKSLISSCNIWTRISKYQILANLSFDAARSLR